ncbi:MAG: ABC transporter ATP-binding protein [Deltaproteobacteria bacterium RBG_16_47_11]|nr:MAG: ABC transporter ATP-binding protein [Deltaproteobacteria bacterium RBG_16_47_11]
MDDEVILKIEGVTKDYGSVKAVDNVSFSINSGKIVGLLGPNGAGKTTTINMILGILDPTQGLIEVFGKNLKDGRSKISKSINFAAVYAHMPANLTVWQNLYVFGLLYEVKNLKEKIKYLLHEFDLERFSDTKAGLLSSGEASRLNLAKAIINNPRLLLLDEPTASLDPNISQLVRQKIKEYVEKTKTATLWTSHNMQEIEAVFDQVFFLSHGKILLSGNPKTLPSEYGKKDLEELLITVAREPLSFGS